MSIEITGAQEPRFEEILSAAALDFLVALDGEFAEARVALLDTRRARRDRFATGQLPEFLPETATIRADPTWRVAPPAPGLVDRRVEITGHDRIQESARRSGGRRAPPPRIESWGLNDLIPTRRGD